MMEAVCRKSVNVLMLGRMGFIPALDLQNRYARAHLDEKAGKSQARGEDTLLLVEHQPVYTVGVRSEDYTQDEVEGLKRTGAEFYRTNRGGLVTFHGPGQLVAYPVLNLSRYKASIKWYVHQLEKTLLATLGQFGLKGRITDQTGVWVDDRKIASIGLHGSRYVTTHGIGLNCNTDLSWFKSIVPCGLPGVDMTSLTQELGHNTSVQDAAQPFLRSFQEVFDCDLEYKMLEKDDLKMLSPSDSPSDSPTDTTADTASDISQSASIAATSATFATVANVSGLPPTPETFTVPKLEQRVETGVRLMSTLSSPSFPSSSSSSSPGPHPTASYYSSLPSSSPNSQYDSGSNRMRAGFRRKTGPMW